MRITSRRKAIATFITLGALLIAIAIALQLSWIILNWRKELMLFVGVILFAVVIAGLVLNTIFLVREIRRNEQQESFLNAVTHELKTPIASLRLYLETLQKRSVEPAQAQQFYRVMLADTERLLGTVEQVLRAGELGHKRLMQSALEVDVRDILLQSIDLVRTRHHLSEQALGISAAPTEAITVMGIPEELRTAFTNVLDNAVKYSLPDNIAIAVELLEDERHADVLVRDQGRGIPPSELKQIFKRFYRVSELAGRKVKGTGLGLFIVQAIVRKHGGTVKAESSGLGRGASIHIRLPKVYQHE